jgi:hypothetical protein
VSSKLNLQSTTAQSLGALLKSARDILRQPLSGQRCDAGAN